MNFKILSCAWRCLVRSITNFHTIMHDLHVKYFFLLSFLQISCITYAQPTIITIISYRFVQMIELYAQFGLQTAVKLLYTQRREIHLDLIKSLMVDESIKI